MRQKLRLVKRPFRTTSKQCVFLYIDCILPLATLLSCKTLFLFFPAFSISQTFLHGYSWKLCYPLFSKNRILKGDWQAYTKWAWKIFFKIGSFYVKYILLFVQWSVRKIIIWLSSIFTYFGTFLIAKVSRKLYLGK